METIPKQIWMAWFQGADKIPSLVQETKKSWEVLNPSWEVHLLDKQTLPEKLPEARQYIDNPKITPQALSDIVRILLLEKYGGVWTDASVLCTRPLDEWIHQHAPQGFFTFEKPRYDKLAVSWFLAAAPHNYIVEKWSEDVRLFWSKGPIAPRLVIKVFQKGQSLLIRWKLAWIVKKIMFIGKNIFGLYPYFWFHYLFNKRYETDDYFKKQWDATPKISADGPHTLAHFGRTEKADERITKFIDDNSTWVHKLAWQIDVTQSDMQSSCTVALIEANKKRHSYN